MNVLEQVLTISVDFVANDATSYFLTSFPGSTANNRALVTSVFLSSDAAYGNNTTSLQVKGVPDTKYPVYQKSLTENSPTGIITPSGSPFVCPASADLYYVFDNDGTGTIKFTILYRQIPAQNIATALKFSSTLIAFGDPDLTIYTNNFDTPVFVKSLIIYNDSNFAIDITVNLIDNAVDYPLCTKVNAPSKETWIYLFPNDFFLLNGQALKVSKTGADDIYVCLSTNSDPLYV